MKLNRKYSVGAICLRYVRSLALVLFCSAIAQVATVNAAGTRSGAEEHSSAATLSDQIHSKIERVAQFRFIRAVARHLGVRVFLSDESAGFFAHYVNENLKRLASYPNESDRFNYDYTRIFPSFAPLTLVVDASPEKIAAFRTLISAHSPLPSDPERWEIRSMGDEQAMPKFTSYDGALIELSADSELRPNFIDDVVNGELRFRPPLPGPGSAPPILAALEYLDQLAEFDQRSTAESLSELRKIVNDFDPHGPESSSASFREQVSAKGIALITKALNVENSFKMLDSLGLRNKLIEFSGNPSQAGDLSWWMKKMPLPSFPVGSGTGPTAGELRLDLVSHGTTSYAAYEAMTRNEPEHPNALISRGHVVGEAAVQGDGYYTRSGPRGASDRTLTVQFHLDPRARKGSDFDVNGDTVLVLNKNSLLLKPERVDIPLLQYFELLSSKQPDPATALTLEPASRRYSYRAMMAEGEDASRLSALIQNRSNRKLLRSKRFPMIDKVIDRYLWDLPSSFARPRHLARLIRHIRPNVDDAKPLIEYAKAHSEIVDALIASGAKDPTRVYYYQAIADQILTLPQALEHPEWVNQILKQLGPDGGFEVIAKPVLESELWSRSPHWPDWVRSCFRSSPWVAQRILPKLPRTAYFSEGELSRLSESRDQKPKSWTESLGCSLSRFRSYLANH